MLKSSILILAISLGISSQSVSQSNTADSLREELKTAQPDTNKIDLLLDLSKSIFRQKPDEAILYAEQASMLATELNYKERLAYALKNIGLGYYIKGDFPEVMTNWKNSLRIFREIDHKQGISNLLNNLGAVHFSKGDDPNALDYYLQSLRIAEEIGDTTRILTSHINIGAVYVHNENTYEKALEYYQAALKVARKQKYYSGIGTAALNIGELYLKTHKNEEAFTYLNESYEAFKIDGGEISRALYFIGCNYDSIGDIPEAIKYHKLAVKEAEIRDSKTDMAIALNGLGNAYNKYGDIQKSIDAHEKSVRLGKISGLNNELRDGYLGLSRAHSQSGNYKKAYDYSTLYTATKDDIQKDDYNEQINNMTFTFDLENKEKEIALLNKDNAIQQEQIKSASTFQKFLYALAGLLLVIIGGVSYQYRFAKKTNKLLSFERNRAESILLNILPKSTAEELKENGFVEAQKIEQATVLFTDFKSFSTISDQISPEDLVKSVDYYFKGFDDIVKRNNLEKIKTIGDAYMCAGGLPKENTTNPEDALNAAFEINEFVTQTKENPPPGIQTFEIRIGLNTGPVVSGVVGTTKFQYDIWGHTVNIAARMETGSEPGKINVSENTYELLKDKYSFSYRGEMKVKNSGMLKMYFAEKEVSHAEVVT